MVPMKMMNEQNERNHDKGWTLMNQLKNVNRSLLTILMVGCFMVVQLVMSSSAVAGAPPTMSINAPVSSQTINSVPYTVSGTCSGGSGTYTSITFDDGSGAVPVSSGPISNWTHSWSPADATYTLNASCTDSAAKTGTATAVSGVVVNTCIDTDVATMTISDPVQSATIGGLYTVYGQVGVETAPLTMGTVQFSLNGGAWTTATGNNGSDSFTISWDTTLVTDGPATVQVRGFDPDCGGTNLITSAVRNVTINNACNDTDLAVVTINPPAESATVSGAYRVKLGITGETVPSGLLSVEFSIDGGGYVAATGWDGSNWYYDWDTTAITGPIAATIDARVTDPDCSTVVNATQRNVTIDNSGPSNTLADCAGCHNYPPVDAVSRDAATGNFIGDHDKHSAYTCATCHVSPATETSVDFAHRTGNLDIDSGNIGVGADNGTYSKGSTFAQSNSPTGGTCSNVDCHNNAVTPQWGVGTTACNTCHTLPPATNAHVAHYTAKGWAADNTNCTVCHPDNTAGHSDVTDASVTVIAGLTPSGTSPAITCATTGTGCHNEKTTPAWNTTNITCTSCHTAGGAAAGDPTTGLHATTNLTNHDGTLTGGTGLACEKCHTASPSNLHFNGTVNNGGTATFAWNTSNIPASYDRTNDFCAAVCHTDSGTWNREWSGVTDAAWAYTDLAESAAVCGNCHGSFFAGWNIIGNTSHDNPDVDNDPDTLATSKGSHTECSACHAWGHTNYSTGTKHENGTLEMNATLDTTPGDGNCTTNCHSPLNLTMNATSGWTDASVVGDGVTCASCHTGGVTPGSASGAHTVHGATAASVAANPASVALCIECHGNDGTGASHNNGTVNFVGATYSTATRNDLTGTCSTTSCHNKGTDQSTAWNTTALACNDCHYFEASPTAANNTAHASSLSTSHGDHFSAGKTCAQCHGTDPVAGDTSHINGGTTANSDKATALQDEATLAWTAASAVTDYTFDDTGNTCYSATNNGLGCHATAGASGAADPTRPDWDVAFASTACTNCHTNTTNALVNPTSGLHGAGLTATNSITGQNHDDSFGTGGTCTSCHTSIPVYTTHKDGTFAGGNGQTSTMGLAAFYTQTANDTGTCATTTCHLGNSDAWAHKWMATANYSNATASCTGCHGNLSSGWNAGVDHLTGEIATDHADDGTTSNYGCEACHALQASTGVYPFTFGTADWLPLNAGNKHGNNLITMNDDGGGTISGWARGSGADAGKSACLKCHGYNDTPTAHDFVNTLWTSEEIVGDGISAGHGVGAACISCHDGMTQGTRRDVGLEFNLTRQHGTNAPTSADCEKCHDESSGPDGVVQLKVWNADNSTFTTATYSSADLSSANTHCVSCHDTTRGVTIGALSAPAGDMSNYTLATTYKSHNFATNGATGTVPEINKAVSPHGNPSGNDLKGVDTYTGVVGCLHCHPSHGSSVASKTATKDANNVAMTTARMLGGLPSSAVGVGFDYTGEGTLQDPNLCWGCHDAATVKVADYYGDTTTGHWNAGTWKSPRFAYKTGKGGVAVLHIANDIDGGTANDTASAIVCTTCHNVHGSTNAQFYQPALKGKWLTSPYPEDRASNETNIYTYANSGGGTPTGTPRAGTTAVGAQNPAALGGGYTDGAGTGAWGYYIDGNTFGMDFYRPWLTGPVTQKYMSNYDATAASMATFGGLCMTACHSAANIETRLTWKGHNNVVPGFGGADTATDLFNVNAGGSRQEMLGQGWYNDTGWGMNLWATAGTERQQGAKKYSHNKEFSWGVNPTTSGAQAGYHQFSCSKCHTPHAAELPALMRTNCLDTKHSTYRHRNMDEAVNCHRVKDATATQGDDAYPGTTWNAVTPW